MSHTEDDAKKLWCSAARDRCIASGCMMWRWASKPNPDWKPDNGMMSTFMRDTRNDPPMYLDDTTRGYCGLAGRP